MNIVVFWASQVLSCLVQIASVRRSLFNNAERAKFLSHLVDGVKRILENPQVSLVCKVVCDDDRGTFWSGFSKKNKCLRYAILKETCLFIFWYYTRNLFASPAFRYSCISSAIWMESEIVFTPSEPYFLSINQSAAAPPDDWLALTPMTGEMT